MIIFFLRKLCFGIRCLLVALMIFCVRDLLSIFFVTVLIEVVCSLFEFSEAAWAFCRECFRRFHIREYFRSFTSLKPNLAAWLILLVLKFILQIVWLWAGSRSFEWWDLGVAYFICWSIFVLLRVLWKRFFVHVSIWLSLCALLGISCSFCFFLLDGFTFHRYLWRWVWRRTWEHLKVWRW